MMPDNVGMLKENETLRKAAEKRRKAMQELRAKGWTDKAIGVKHSISRARVQFILGRKS